MLYDMHKKLNAMKLRKSQGTEAVTNGWLRHILRTPLVHLTHLIRHCLCLTHLQPLKGSKLIALRWLCKGHNFRKAAFNEPVVNDGHVIKNESYKDFPKEPRKKTLT
jgi:hypothetical protein